MQIKCSECQTVFDHIYPPQGGGQPVTCSDECREIRKSRRNKEYYAAHKTMNSKRYKEWEKKNQEKVVANQKKQYENRKANEKLQDYEYSDTPVGRQWQCKRCGKWSSGRINCPVCRKILSEGVSGEYENCIYESSDIGMELPL